MQNSFSIKSPNFWLSILIAFFGVLTATGIELPADPQTFAGNLLQSVTTQGWFGLIGTFGASLFGLVYQIYNKVRDGGWNIPALLGSPNTVLYLVGLLGSIFTINGISISSESLQTLVSAIYNADYFGAIAAAFGIIQILVRYFRNKRTGATV